MSELSNEMIWGIGIGIAVVLLGLMVWRSRVNRRKAEEAAAEKAEKQRLRKEKQEAELRALQQEQYDAWSKADGEGLLSSVGKGVVIQEFVGEPLIVEYALPSNAPKELGTLMKVIKPLYPDESVTRKDVRVYTTSAGTTRLALTGPDSSPLELTIDDHTLPLYAASSKRGHVDFEEVWKQCDSGK